MGVSRLSGGAQMRKEINKQLVGWIRERARTSFGGDISLMAIYGSHVNGTDQEWSDVDCYFIPKTDRGRAFGLDFILAGVGYDIFPLSWERLQGIAHLQEPLVPLVGDAVLLYSDSQEDTDRFQALQRELAACLADKAYCRRMCEERFYRAAAQRQLGDSGDFSTQRKCAGQLLLDGAEALAFHNGTYFHAGLKRHGQELEAMEKKPAGFLRRYRQVMEAESPGALQKASEDFLTCLGEFFGLPWKAVPGERPLPSGEKEENLAELSAWYEECSSLFCKLRVCREREQRELAFLSGVCLQRELDELAASYAVPAYALLEAYHWADLTPLVETADRIERDLVDRIVRSGGRIKRFASFPEFERAQL